MVLITACRPVLITDAMNDWPALSKWDWSYFLNRYGDHLVAMKAVHVCQYSDFFMIFVSRL